MNQPSQAPWLPLNIKNLFCSAPPVHHFIPTQYGRQIKRKGKHPVRTSHQIMLKNHVNHKPHWGQNWTVAKEDESGRLRVYCNRSPPMDIVMTGLYCKLNKSKLKLNKGPPKGPKGSTKVRIGVRTVRPVRKFSIFLVFGLFGVWIVQAVRSVRCSGGELRAAPSHL